MDKKIKNRLEISEICDNVRDQLKIVTTNGCYDLLHLGHVNTFTLAKGYGHMLVVGVNSDESIRRYKSPSRPVVPENDRAFMVASLGVVDYVVIFDEDTPVKLLDAIKPHYHIKSDAGYKGIERAIIETNGGRIITVPDLPGYSSGQLVRKAAEVYIRDVLQKEM